MNEGKTRIIGIDPGTIVAGYAVIGTENGGEYTSLACGAWKFKQQNPLAERLSRLAYEFNQIVSKYKPNIVCLETPFVAFNVRSALTLGAARGVILQHAFEHGLEIFEVSATSAKKSITGDGYANKKKVALFLTSLLQMDLSSLSLDATDALAIAYSHVYRNMSQASSEPKINSKVLQEWSASIRKSKRCKCSFTDL